MQEDITAHNNKQTMADKGICVILATEISHSLPEAEN